MPVIADVKSLAPKSLIGLQQVPMPSAPSLADFRPLNAGLHSPDMDDFLGQA